VSASLPAKLSRYKIYKPFLSVPDGAPEQPVQLEQPEQFLVTPVVKLSENDEIYNLVTQNIITSLIKIHRRQRYITAT